MEHPSISTRTDKQSLMWLLRATQKLAALEMRTHIVRKCRRQGKKIMMNLLMVPRRWSGAVSFYAV
jgi:hypothetical protein